jgi:hypothetical protein
MYYTISRVFINIPSIIILYSSPSILFKNKPSPNQNNNTDSQYSYLCIYLFLLS